jgi:glycosyltransferase involved in cell wall biosynthesis
MRVLILGQYFWPENFRINEVADSLLRAGCTVSVLTGPPNYPDGKVFPGYSAASLHTERKGDVMIHRIPMVPRGNGSASRLALNYLSFVGSACCFGPWLLRGQSYDVVLVYAPGPILQSIPALWLGRLKGASVITWVQDLWPDSLEVTGFIRNKRLLGLIAHVVRWIYRCNDLLLVQSHSFIEPVKAMAGATPVLYHPNPGELPIDASALDQEPELRLNPGFNVVFAGNLGTVQALDTVLDAAYETRQHTDLWWVLLGSGSRSAWLATEVQRRDLKQVLLPGRFAPEAMPPILAQASVLLVSLVRSPIMSLTIPSKVQAYLAAGRPIIAALDGEGARVVVEAGAGVACAAEDAVALANAVLQLRSLSQDEMDRMGESGRTFYRGQFDPDILAQRMVAIFHQTLESAPNNHA